jgi:hypothetical protein
MEAYGCTEQWVYYKNKHRRYAFQHVDSRRNECIRPGPQARITCAFKK